jgi:hypothetical protein
MITTAEDAKALVEELSQRAPGACDLARAVSIAARIEPELLRAMRREVFPHLRASDEADFWLSECVESQGPRWVTMSPAVAEELRAHIVAGEGSRFRTVIATIHASIAPLVQLEEHIHSLSLGGAAHRDAIENELKPVLNSLRSAEDTGVAQWAARTIPRLSSWVRALPIAWAIRAVAHQRLGGTVNIQSGKSTESLPPDAAAILRDLVPMTELWVRLTEGALEVSRDRVLGGHAITVPATFPIPLEVKHERAEDTIGVRDAICRVAVRQSVDIRAISGAMWRLSPTQTTTKVGVELRFMVAPIIDEATDITNLDVVFTFDHSPVPRSIIQRPVNPFIDLAERSHSPVIFHVDGGPYGSAPSDLF